MNIWVITIVIMVASLIIQQTLNSKFNKYSKVPTSNGMTGAEVAQKMLYDNGIYDVKVVPTRGMLTDHYNPATKTVNLSEGVYASRSVAAAAVAAHECGHAVQHQVGYAPIKLRNGMVPFVNICSHLAIPIILLGLFISAELAMFGVILYCAVFAFQIVTLPTETNASARAINTLYNMGILDEDELKGTKKVLNAAAMTYFASAAATALQVLRLFLLVSGNRRRD